MINIDMLVRVMENTDDAVTWEGDSWQRQPFEEHFDMDKLADTLAKNGYPQERKQGATSRRVRGGRLDEGRGRPTECSQRG